tara:strand:- start:577 stop:1560 length:984 start_codon:yes stop_codon:yes gene_type:complete
MGGIPDIRINGQSIQEIGVNGTGIRFIGTRQIYNPNIRVLGTNAIADTRIWTRDTSVSVPQAPPVTIQAGSPIVDMPGCVKVHKENAKTRNRNKMLVDDDPKGNTVLCDNGMPYFVPPNYDARDLTWQTIYQEAPEQEGGVNTGDTGDVTPPETPEPPPTDEPEGDPECPGPLSPRIGSVGPNEKEKVVGHELQPDPNNFNKKICVALYEDINIVEQYLPSPQVATTTAVIASVAGASALLAKPLADLLLRVFRPAIKQALTKVNAILGKTPYRLTEDEKKTNEYRLKKGLPAIPFAKNHQKKLKAEKKAEKQKKKSEKTQKKNPQS